MRIAAFTKYDTLAASTRQRVLQYAPHLRAAGFELLHHPLLPNDYVRGLATDKRYPPWRLFPPFAKRLLQLIRTDADVIWVYAELFPQLPALFEKLVAASGKPVVYDFDDAFFENYESSWMLRGKLTPLMKHAHVCCAGNAYLRDYAGRLCPNSVILPTVVDTEIYQPKASSNDPPVIGWIGSPSTWTYVRQHLPLLRSLNDSGRARVRIIGAGAGAKADHFPGLELVEWSEATEVADVQSLDIGIMPLPDDDWARGKSGYKLIQYMACGLPVVASPVGVNREIVEDRLNGLLAETEAQWSDALERLVNDLPLRRRMGMAGRSRVVEAFSLKVHGPRLVGIMEECFSRGSR